MSINKLEAHVNRKKLIAGLAILAVLIILVSAGAGFLLTRLKKQPQAHQRLLVSNLGYCNSNNLKPCIVSFGLDADGSMLVNLLAPAAYPDFYLTIGDVNVVNKYECQQAADFPTNVHCTGTEMYPGTALQFSLVSIKDDTVLAEGNFAIIGLLLPNPEEEATATPLATETFEPIETPTAFLLEIFTPLPTPGTPILITPSYPNPSYPNPSYP